VLPSDLVRAAEDECKRTLAGSNDMPIKDRARQIVASFSKLGVTAAMIEARLGHSLDNVLPEELGELRTIYTSIKSGVTKAGEWFGGAKAAPEESAILDEGIVGRGAISPEPKPATKKAKPAPAAPAPPVEQPEPEPAPSPAAQPVTDDSGDIFG
jgi:hypothetical protein